MIDREHDLPISRQAEALGVSRGTVYYKPWANLGRGFATMRRLDELHLGYPFAGSRMLRDFLNREGVSIGRRYVASLMKRIGIAAIYRRPNTSKPAPGHKIYLYLLRRLKIERARSSGRGRWISPTSRWLVASSIWRPSSTGTVGAS